MSKNSQNIFQLTKIRILTILAEFGFPDFQSEIIYFIISVKICHTCAVKNSIEQNTAKAPNHNRISVTSKDNF